jgi:hypothetical protein
LVLVSALLTQTIFCLVVSNIFFHHIWNGDPHIFQIGEHHESSCWKVICRYVLETDF